MDASSSGRRTVVTALRLSLEFVRANKLLVLRFALTSAGRAATTVGVILLIREFLAGVLSADGTAAAEVAASVGQATALWLVAGALLAAFFIGSLCSYDNQVVTQRIVRRIELLLMQRMIAHLVRLPVAFFDKQQQGDLLEAIRQDITRVRMAFMAIADVVLQGAQVVAYAGAAIWLSPVLAATAFPIFLAAAIPIWWLSARIRAGSFRVRRRGFVLSDLMLQLMRGIRLMKVYAGERAAALASTARARAYFDEVLAVERVRALGGVALETLAGLSIVIVTVVGGFQVLSGSLTLPSLVAFLVAARTLHGPLNKLNAQLLDVHRYWSSVERVRELLEMPTGMADRPGAVPVESPVRSIEFDDVSFGYGPGTLVLDRATFSVRAGEQIGIVGRSGAGKTTLVSLVARFYDPVDGAVRLNGRDLRDYRLADVYRQVALVTQDPFVFSASVGDNIKYGRVDADDAAVEAAARAAEIHDEIMALPAGYDTLVGPGGRLLSAGQVQRINAARALLKDAPILILDEPTSSLDAVSERKLQRAVDRLKAGRTTFIVAHRLSTLSHVDRIIVLDAGRIVDVGPHQELITRCPEYARLWHAQVLEAAQASEPPGASGVVH